MRRNEKICLCLKYIIFREVRKDFWQAKSGFKTLWKTGERKLPGQFFLSKRGRCSFKVEPAVSDLFNDEDLLIAYWNRPTGGLFREEVYFLEENLLHANSKLRMRVAPCCHWKSFVYSERYSTYSEQRDHTMCEVVTYKTLENNGNNKRVWPKRVHGRLWVVVVNERFSLKGFDWDNFGVLQRWSLTGSPRATTFRKRPGSTVFPFFSSSLIRYLRDITCLRDKRGIIVVLLHGVKVCW